MEILYLPNSYSQQRQHEKKANIYPVLMAMEAQKYRNEGHEVYWGNKTGNYNFVFDYGDHRVLPYDKIISEPEGLPFLSLPHPDRVFTRAKYYDSGNYKYRPGTHIMSASGCVHGKCTFCIENGKPYEVRPVEDVMSELQEIRHMKFKEAFDDSATFPTGDWLDEFCKFRIAVKDPLPLSCNMRIDSKVDYKLLKQSNFRMLLFGIESGNQVTLNRIQKGINADDIIPTIKKASDAGLEPHGCFVFGWEWESDSDALRTLRLVHYLLRKGFAKTAQASFIHQQGFKGNESQRKYIRRIYDIKYSPEFWFNQIKDIKDIDDLKYLWKKIKVGINESLIRHTT